MRPLYHPSIDEITVQGILYALSDPVRVAIFVYLSEENAHGQNCTTFQNMGSRSLPKSTLSQHFKILREAGLIRSERQGVELKNYSRSAELKEPFGAMIQSILKAYSSEGGCISGVIESATGGVKNSRKPAAKKESQ